MESKVGTKSWLNSTPLGRACIFSTVCVQFTHTFFPRSKQRSNTDVLSGSLVPGSVAVRFAPARIVVEGFGNFSSRPYCSYAEDPTTPEINLTTNSWNPLRAPSSNAAPTDQTTAKSITWSSMSSASFRLLDAPCYLPVVPCYYAWPSADCYADEGNDVSYCVYGEKMSCNYARTSFRHVATIFISARCTGKRPCRAAQASVESSNQSNRPWTWAWYLSIRARGNAFAKDRTNGSQPNCCVSMNTIPQRETVAGEACIKILKMLFNFFCYYYNLKGNSFFGGSRRERRYIEWFLY